MRRRLIKTPLVEPTSVTAHSSAPSGPMLACLRETYPDVPESNRTWAATARPTIKGVCEVRQTSVRARPGGNAAAAKIRCGCCPVHETRLHSADVASLPFLLLVVSTSRAGPRPRLRRVPTTTFSGFVSRPPPLAPQTPPWSPRNPPPGPHSNRTSDTLLFRPLSHYCERSGAVLPSSVRIDVYP